MSAAHHENIEEIKMLVGLAETKTPEQREFLYNRIGEFLVDDKQAFSSSEKEIMADIICRITADVEKSIRANFAKKLANRADVPPSLMAFLANDDIEVALPILRDCGLLAENDLLEIVKLRSKQHRLAVAARDNIGENVCTALCEINDPDITVTLLQNHTAQMPLLMLSYLGEQSEFIPEYQRPLLERPFLPQPIAEKMYRWVSISLREYICANFEVDVRALEMDILDREKTIEAISGDSDPSFRLVEKLHRSGDLSTRFMIKSLHQGEIDLFEFAFAKLLDVDIDQARAIIYTDNPEILAVACRSLNIDRVIFKTIYDLTASIRDKSSSILSPVKSVPMDFYDLLTQESAAAALKNEDFMSGNIKYSETC
ncbi:DUF2336 domain-containing protein [Sneathiella chungangensis]|uniref:DUF2336 domain-containing protein n=1 Tax=Sneathiella chungangensis TaxID=1418234 RepID=A0A845MD49_9PROT|nr:DUF2336 domain-containing protein [Sneathiella chungangensis]MZR21256.1 DUF2336 domain-containing protein [Sneathiella chungangensis]